MDTKGSAQVGKLGLSLAPAPVDAKGVSVVGVESGSVADQKGFQTGDVIAGSPSRSDNLNVMSLTNVGFRQRRYAP